MRGGNSWGIHARLWWAFMGIRGYSWAFVCLGVPRCVRTHSFRAGFLGKWLQRAVFREREMSSELSSIMILLVGEERRRQ